VRPALLVAFGAMLCLARVTAAQADPAAGFASHIDNALAVDLLRHVDALAAVGALPGARDGPRGVSRGYLAPQAAAARGLLLEWMRGAGMAALVDGAGNVIGRLVCEERGERKTVVLGSHHDTVVSGGKWDGAYGVLGAIAVVQVVKEREEGVCGLPFDLEVVAFDDEEGNNPFGLTNTGAKAYVGADVVVGGDGPQAPARRTLFASAYRAAFGRDVGGGGGEEKVGTWDERAVFDGLRNASRANGFVDVLGFVELHIEQGPVLESAGKALGVVTAISGQTRMTLTLRGQAGHAGTVPMPLRKDALVAASRIILDVEEVALKRGDGVVGTVGMIHVEGGGGTNIVPSAVTLSLDVRAPTDAARDAAVAEILARARATTLARGLGLVVTTDHEAGAVQMADWLREIARKSVRLVHARDGDGDAGEWCSADSGSGEGAAVCGEPSSSGEGRGEESLDVLELPSGAGHDAQLLASVADSAMIFVRCRGGISHSPLEYVADADAVAGAYALLKMVEGMAEHVKKQGVA
jgi:allantoate deiminase